MNSFREGRERGNIKRYGSNPPPPPCPKPPPPHNPPQNKMQHPLDQVIAEMEAWRGHTGYPSARLTAWAAQLKSMRSTTGVEAIQLPPKRVPADYAEGDYGRDDLAAIWNACREAVKRKMGEPVGYLITWNGGAQSLSFDRCHEDDGTCEPVYAPHPTRCWPCRSSAGCNRRS